DTLRMVRPHDRRRVQFNVIAKSPGGQTGRGFDPLCVILDEAEFIDPKDKDAAIDDRQIVGAMTPRLLPGVSVVMCSTPGSPNSMMAQLFEKNHGHPIDGLAAVCPT